MATAALLARICHHFGGLIRARSGGASAQAQPAQATRPAASLWGPFTPSNHAGQYFQLDYPASTTEGALQIGVRYTLWIPDNVRAIRALIVHQHGAGIPAAQSGATSAYDLHWQALAKKWNCALLGPSYHVLNDTIDLTPGGSELWFDPRHGSDQAFLKALPRVQQQIGPRTFPGACGGTPEGASGAMS
jgi:hypothetical protein